MRDNYYNTMTMKLIQKSFFDGTREFELVDDVVNVRIKKLFKEEKLTVGLLILNPKPIINEPYLEFHDRYKGNLLLSLLLNKPNAEEFNIFVDALKQGALGKNNPLADVETEASESSRAEALARNVYEEPPEFDESDEIKARISFQPVNAGRLDDDITMLKSYLDEDDIKPLLDSLETLKAEPQNEAAFQKVVDIFNDLGNYTGAVLTYAPYLKVLISQSLGYK